MNNHFIKTCLLYFFGIIFFIGCENSFHEKNVLLANKKIIEILNKNKLPGISVTVLKSGNKIYSKAFGYSDVDLKKEIDPAKTLFRIGSFSKTLTASALMFYEEKKQVLLDSNVNFYLKDYPEKKWNFTPRQLAGHLSGIRHYKKNEMYINQNFDSVFDALKIFSEDSLLHKPNTKYLYSTHAWVVLSAVIEKIAGKPFLSVMKDQVFDPLKMKNTYADIEDLSNKNVVKYYQYKDSSNSYELAPKVNNSWKWAGGGFLSTTEDVAAFLLAHSSPGFLNSKSLKTLQTSQEICSGEKTNYGLGWRTKYDRKNNPLIGHTGGSIGGTTYAFLSPKNNVILVIASNIGSAQFEDLALNLFEIFE